MLSLNKHYNLGELSYSQVDQNWDDLENEVNGLSSRLPLNNYAATTDPTVNNDVTQGYTPGSQWFNRTTDTLFVNTNASSGSANWVLQSAVAGSFGSAAFMSAQTGPNDINPSHLISGEGFKAHLDRFKRGFGQDGRYERYTGSLNDIDHNSTYNFDSGDTTDGPPDLPTWGFVTTLMHVSGTNYARQIVWSMNSGSALWSRRNQNGVWGTTWDKFAVSTLQNTFTANQTIQANLTVTGSVSKGSGSFKIPHPLPSKAETHHLVHSFIEGPRADLIYRGRATLKNGQATVQIDADSGMTDGTFVLLCRDVQAWAQNDTGWSPVRASVSGSTVSIVCQDSSSSDSVSWLVVGERQDPHIMETDWTDEDGRVIVEPEIEEVDNVETEED